MAAFVLGLIGDSGSGKNTVADAVAALLGPERTTDLRLDDYHRFTREERTGRSLTALNPIVHNLPLMKEHLSLLRQGRQIRNRSYNHSDGSFGPIRTIEAREIVIVRGLLGYPTDELRAMYDLAVFLAPEPDLLFRWKLRRDVHSRGYTETEVLKNITHHLLDATEFVLPQAARADLVVSYQTPQWDAPDSEVRTTLLFRRGAAGAVEEVLDPDNFDGGLQWERSGDDLQLRLPHDLSEEAVDTWANARFPDTYGGEGIGVFTGDDGKPARSARLAFVEVLIASLTESMRGE
ncbi:MAG TPA: hypothetical protein VFI91_01125 [Longimicrobiaceae bacterium]|nr:hypothetical protein [Longimicrobiaceae bacterium]